MKAFAILLALTLITGCVGNGGTQTVITDIKPDTRDDMAACGMGISASTGVSVKVAVDVENYNGEVTAAVKEELGTEFSKRYPNTADATKALELYLGCLKTRTADRKAEKKQAAVTACKAAWRCDFNQVEGFCLCNEVSREIQKERGLSETQTLKIISDKCGFNFQQCWPDQNLQKGRADCEAILSEAAIALPKKSTTKTCTYEWSPT